MVAVDSLVAMTIRIAVWGVILALLLVQRRRSLQATNTLPVSP